MPHNENWCKHALRYLRTGRPLKFVLHWGTCLTCKTLESDPYEKAQREVPHQFARNKRMIDAYFKAIILAHESGKQTGAKEAGRNTEIQKQLREKVRQQKRDIMNLREQLKKVLPAMSMD